MYTERDASSRRRHEPELVFARDTGILVVGGLPRTSPLTERSSARPRSRPTLAAAEQQDLVQRLYRVQKKESSATEQQRDTTVKLPPLKIEEMLRRLSRDPRRGRRDGSPPRPTGPETSTVYLGGLQEHVIPPYNALRDSALRMFWARQEFLLQRHKSDAHDSGVVEANPSASHRHADSPSRTTVGSSHAQRTGRKSSPSYTTQSASKAAARAKKRTNALCRTQRRISPDQSKLPHTTGPIDNAKPAPGAAATEAPHPESQAPRISGSNSDYTMSSDSDNTAETSEAPAHPCKKEESRRMVVINKFFGSECPRFRIVPADAPEWGLTFTSVGQPNLLVSPITHEEEEVQRWSIASVPRGFVQVQLAAARHLVMSVTENGEVELRPKLPSELAAAQTWDVVELSNGHFALESVIKPRFYLQARLDQAEKSLYLVPEDDSSSFCELRAVPD